MAIRELTRLLTPSSSTSTNTESKKLRCYCLKPFSRIKVMKNKGAILVVVWSFLATAGIYSYITYVGGNLGSMIMFSFVQAAVGLTTPFFGWLSDAQFGRYSVMTCCLWMMWIGCMLYTVKSVVSEVTYIKYDFAISISIIILMGLSYCGFQANFIQFGTDQLIDASSTETKAFVTWCIWAFFASELALNFLLSCVEFNRLLAALLVCCFLTTALVLNIQLKHVLTKEPPAHNPFKLVYGVVAYAIKHKYPECRSAFTYNSEDDNPGRIDFGKNKYGGPFTIEQVEDVKTLFRIVILCCISGPIFVFTESRSSAKLATTKLFRNEDTSTPKFSECSSDFMITGMYYISGTVMIPLYEFLIYPIFYRCSQNTRSTHKFVVGTIIGMLKILGCLSLIMKAHDSSMKIPSNSTLHCLLHEPAGVLGAYVDYRWTALFQFLNAVSDILIMVGMLEFYCAQVPYSMKGMVAGISYSTIALCLPVFSGIEKAFEKSSLSWGTGVINCEFWYFMTLLLLLVMLLIASFIMLKWYKRRKRQDVLPNEQIFAERYYTY